MSIFTQVLFEHSQPLGWIRNINIDKAKRCRAQSSGSLLDPAGLIKEGLNGQARCFPAKGWRVPGGVASRS